MNANPPEDRPAPATPGTSPTPVMATFPLTSPPVPPPPPGAPRTPPTARRRRSGEASQLLILAWCLYLLGSWAITMRVDSPVRATVWMFFGCVVGLMILWPVVRLSQGNLGTGPESAAATISPRVIWTDWICLMLVFQTVIWPLKVTAEWSLVQTVWLDLSVVAWTLLISVVVACGCLSARSVVRTAAMVICVAVFIGEPAIQASIQWLFQPEYSLTWSWRLSPLNVLNTILASQGGAPTPEIQVQVVTTLAVGILGWVLLSRRSHTVAGSQAPSDGMGQP